MEDRSTKNTVYCLCCKYQTKDRCAFLKHARMHQFEKGFRIPCFHCIQHWNCFKKHRKHMQTCMFNKNRKKQKLNFQVIICLQVDSGGKNHKNKSHTYSVTIILLTRVSSSCDFYRMGSDPTRVRCKLQYKVEG